MTFQRALVGAVAGLCLVGTASAEKLTLRIDSDTDWTLLGPPVPLVADFGRMPQLHERVTVRSVTVRWNIDASEFDETFGRVHAFFPHGSEWISGAFDLPVTGDDQDDSYAHTSSSSVSLSLPDVVCPDGRLGNWLFYFNDPNLIWHWGRIEWWEIEVRYDSSPSDGSTDDLRGNRCVAPAELVWGEPFTVRAQVLKAAEVAGRLDDEFVQDFVLSADRTFGNEDDYRLGSYVHTASIGFPPSTSGMGTREPITPGPEFEPELALPTWTVFHTRTQGAYTGTGPFYIGMITDARDDIAEANEANNTPGHLPRGTDWDSFTITPSLSVYGGAMGQSTAVEGSVAVFAVKISPPTRYETVTVDFTTSPVTEGGDGLSVATAGDDYQPTTGTLTFEPGSHWRQIHVPITNDSAPEPDEVFLVTLRNPVNAAVLGDRALGTIEDDDGPGVPVMRIEDARAVEGDTPIGGPTPMSVTVGLNPPGPLPVTLAYVTRDGTAKADVKGDYLDVADGTLQIPAGATSGVIDLSAYRDLTPEIDERFDVRILRASNAAVERAEAQCLIANDDGAVVWIMPWVSVSDFESTGLTTVRIPIRLSEPLDHHVNVTWSTRDGTATAGQQYVNVNGATATFAPGQRQAFIRVHVARPGSGGGFPFSRDPVAYFFVDLADADEAAVYEDRTSCKVVLVGP